MIVKQFCFEVGKVFFENPLTLTQRHLRKWLKQFCTPSRVSSAGHSHLITDSELRKAYEAHDPQLPEYAASAMQVFAEKELS